MSTSPDKQPPAHEVKPESESVIASEGSGAGGVSENEASGEPSVGAGQPASELRTEAETKETAPSGSGEAGAGSAGGATVSVDHGEEQKDTPADKTDSMSSTLPVASAARVPTPSSRTSTPPVPSKKKFSSVSVTKEFLSKAVSPAPAPAKLVRPAATAAPSQSTNKLLSSKLTTVPSSKPSVSPNPPAVAPSSSSSSPWAKPAVLDSMPLQHPAPTRSGMPNVAMGSGQGLGRRAWGHVGAGEQRRTGPGPGISRDFPTATEVAEGKRKAMLNAQAIAQAEAAHNQAILADLNAFTHIEANAHRWDEEDEDEEIIDFGDGHTYSVAQPPRQPEPAHDEPVAKSERFGEDIGRSWPRRAASPPRQGQAQGQSERVLFNANSNRLEPSSRAGQQQQPPPPPHQQHQPPVRLMSREAPHGHVQHDRAPPPHMADSGRMLPPHMSGGSHAPPQSAAQPRRNSWRAPPSSDREVPPHLAGHHAPSEPQHHQQPVSRPAPTRAPPPRAPQQAPPPPPKAPSVTSPMAPTVPLPAAIPPADDQAAEMHSAAEKARLRRLAEEAEREAAAERARQKARELAERFGSKPAAPAAAPTAAPPVSAPAPPPGLSKPAPPPGLEKPPPQITIAARPKPEGTAEQGPAAPADAAQSWRRSGPLPEPRGKARRASNDPAKAEVPRDLRRAHDASQQVRQAPSTVPGPVAEGSSTVKPRADVGMHDHIAAPVPQSSKREANFDTMLARLQAAMNSARVSPPPGLDRKLGLQQSLIDAVEDGNLEMVDSAMLAEAAEAAEAATKPKSKPKPSASHLPNLPPDYFETTQLEIPRSPPPAWRIYAVKLPSRSPPARGNIPRWRLKQAEGPRVPAPRGWWMTYVPPIANLPPSHSLPDLLLPQPIGRRFAKQVDTGPIISISPRRLLPYQRKSKRRATLESRPDPLPTASFEAPQTEPALHTQEPLLPPHGGLSGVNVNTRLAVPQPTTAEKPAVRFMVTSELDGDSLLEEVNKMSLEHIGEAEEKGSKEGEVKKPRTPPPTTSQTLNSTSPSATQGPWAKSTLAYNVTSPRGDARSDVQRERVKSVWEQSAETKPPAPAPDTPMYPSLNSPAVAAEQIPKAYAMSQQSSAASASAFSRGSFSQPYQFRGSGTTSPEANYGLNRNGAGSANGFQQGLWAPAPGFGNSMASPAYGYNKGGEKFKEGYEGFRYSAGYQGAYNGFPQQQQAQQFRAPSYGYGHTGFGTQMGTPMAARSGSAGGGRFPNGEYMGMGMGYDQNYFQGNYEFGAGQQAQAQAGGGQHTQGQQGQQGQPGQPGLQGQQQGQGHVQVQGQGQAHPQRGGVRKMW